MRLQSFLLGCYLFIPALLYAQYDALTSSEKVFLATLPTLPLRVDTLNEWAFNASGTKTQQYALLALQWAQQSGYQRGKGDAYVRLGSAAQDLSNFELASEQYRSALNVRKRLRDQDGQASCYNRLAQCQKALGKHAGAIMLCREGIQIYDKRPLHINAAYLYNTMADAARLSGRHALADSAFQAGIYCYKALTQTNPTRRDYTKGLASLRMNAAAHQQENSGQYTLAKAALISALKDFTTLKDTSRIGKCLLLLGNNAYYKGQLDSAAVYIQQGLAYEGKIATRDFFTLIKNRGRIALDRSDYPAAYQDIRTALHFFSNSNNAADLANAQFEMGNWFYEQSLLDSAVFYYRKAVEQNVQYPLLQGRVLYFLSDALDLKGQKTAADAATAQYIHILEDLQLDKNTFTQLINHQLDKNRLLKRLMQREKQQAYRITWLVAGILLSLLFLAVFTVRLNRQRRLLAEIAAQTAQQQETIALKQAAQALQDAEIARHNEQLVIQEKLDLIKNKEIERHYARIEAQDAMKRQIGAELHDGVGAMLTAVKLGFAPVDEVLDNLPDDKQNHYRKANQLLDETCAEVRRIAHQLSSSLLLRFGLKAQLEALADILKESGQFNVNLELHALDERFDSKTEMNTYRIVQELVNNIVKHAQANEITIQANRFDNLFNIIVEDNGKGFDPDQAEARTGAGLTNIRARVHDMKGNIFIDSRPGRGTAIVIDIPVFPQNKI